MVNTPSSPGPCVLVVGASRGIGLEFVRQYAAAGWRVYATTRTPGDHGPLGRVDGDVALHELDVREASHIARLRGDLADEAIDVLIHNAGILDRGVDREEIMAVNAKAPMRVAAAFLDRVAASEQRKLVLMTSELGSRRGRTGSLGLYGDSKAALNDRFRAAEPNWRERGITAIVMHPGWVRTDMGGFSAPVAVEDSVAGIRRVLAALTPADSGCFLTWEGDHHPW